MPQPPLTQYVIFMQSHILGVVHIAVRHRKALRRQHLGRVVMDRFFGNQNAPRVNAQVIRQADQSPRYLHHLGRLRVFPRPRRRVAHQQVDFFLRQAINFGHLPQRRPPLKGRVGRQQGRVVAAVTLEYVIDHVVALVPTEVDVKIGRAGAVGVDEALKVEV